MSPAAEPTVSEIVRRLDDITRRFDDLITRLEGTYQRRDVSEAEKIAEQVERQEVYRRLITVEATTTKMETRQTRIVWLAMSGLLFPILVLIVSAIILTAMGHPATGGTVIPLK